MVARPPRPRFHSAEVLPEFIIWSENPAGNWLQLPRSFVGKLPAAGPGGLWLQADVCCSRASWVEVDVRRRQRSLGLRLADICPRARPGQAMNPPLQV